MSWKEINQKIRKCRALSDAEERIKCLRQLFVSTQDGMVAFVIGEELEAYGNLREALQYFEMAKRLFPKDNYKDMATKAILRVENKLQGEKERGTITVPPLVRLEEIKLEEYDLATTLLVVACTKTKIWDIDKDAPNFVPAQFAYQGKDFHNFLLWLDSSARRIALDRGDFRWIILSAKYGYIEPWHPICNYNVKFGDETTGPISDETLYRQVMYQSRWSGIYLKDFKTVICCGSKVYADKVRVSFKDTRAQIIHAVLE